MTDRDTTLSQLKEIVRDLVIQKGWAADGVQNPQNVVMAMTVEMSELLEKFAWLDGAGVDRLLRGEEPERVSQIAEEFVDVMMYGLQLTRTLNIDITEAILKKIEIVKRRPNGVRGRDCAR